MKYSKYTKLYAENVSCNDLFNNATKKDVQILKNVFIISIHCTFASDQLRFIGSYNIENK